MTDIRQDAFRAPAGVSVAADNTNSNSLARWMVITFMLGMVVPVWINIGSIVLMPHRLVLLVMFVPSFFMLFSGKAGPVRGFDILMLVSALWAALALLANGTVLGASIPQQVGIYVLETFGAYMLARVSIRSVADFSFFTRAFFVSLLILVPFGVFESITHRPIMLELIPQSVSINGARPRWGLRRAQAVFAHPILFGVYCSAGFGLLWYVMRSSLTRWGGLFLAFAGTFFSLSSGALIAIIMQSAFIAWDKITKSVPHRWRIFTGLAVLGYVTIDLLSNRNPFHVLVSYGTFNSTSAYNRILIWRHGMESVWAHPMFGLGADVILWERPEWVSASVDNFWLLFAMQYGIPCFAFLAIALFLILRGISVADLKDSHSQVCRAGYLICVGGLILAGGTVHYWHGIMAFVMFLFGAGIWMIQDPKSPGTETSDGPEVETPDARRLTYTRQTKLHHRTSPTNKAAE